MLRQQCDDIMGQVLAFRAKQSLQIKPNNGTGTVAEKGLALHKYCGNHRQIYLRVARTVRTIYIVVFSTSILIPLTALRVKSSSSTWNALSRSLFFATSSSSRLSSSRPLALVMPLPGILPIVLSTTPCGRMITLELELRSPPNPNPEKGEPGLDFCDAVGPAVKAIVPVDCATVSEPRSRRSRISRQARTGDSITLNGIQIAEIVCRGLEIGMSVREPRTLPQTLTVGRRCR